MADNYIGNRMDDYLSGRLSQSRPRKLTPSGRKPGTMELKVEPEATVWISEGALTIPGMRLIELIANSGQRVFYRAPGGKSGSEPAIRFGARHYPPEVDAPEAEMTVAVTPEEVIIDSGRVIISFPESHGEEAAAIAAAFLTEPGRKAKTARIEL